MDRLDFPFDPPAAKPAWHQNARSGLPEISLAGEERRT